MPVRAFVAEIVNPRCYGVINTPIGKKTPRRAVANYNLAPYPNDRSRSSHAR